MKNIYIYLLAILFSAFLFSSNNRGRESFKNFSLTFSDRMIFSGLKLNFLSNHGVENWILNIGLGSVFNLDDKTFYYYSMPIEILNRKKINEKLFLDFGGSFDIYMDKETNFFQSFSPSVGISKKLKQKRQIFIKSIRFSILYNILEDKDATYYPRKFSIKSDIGF